MKETYRGGGSSWEEERLQEAGLRWDRAVRRGNGAPPAQRPPGRIGGRCHHLLHMDDPAVQASTVEAALQAAGQHFSCVGLSVPTLELSFKSGTSQEEV